MKRNKQKHGMEFYLHKKNRKTPIFTTTRATGNFLAIIHEDHPEMTIQQLRDFLSDRTQWIYEPEAIACLDAYIYHGEANVIPQFKCW